MFIPKEIAQNLAMLLPPVRGFAKRWHHTGTMNDPAQAQRLFDDYAQHTPPAGMDLLELGPGQSPRVLQNALRAGAKSVTGLDVTDYFAGRPPVGIRIRLYDGRAMPFENDSFDLIWSTSCF